MTTNYTHIINENLDMFDNTVIPSIKEEAEAVSEKLRYEEEEARWYEETATWLRDTMRKLCELDENEYAFEELWALYSDVYKDMHGIRPSRDSIARHKMWMENIRRYNPEILL